MHRAPCFLLRLAMEKDIPALHALMDASVRGLQAADCNPAQINGALGTVLGVDTQLIRDRTYFVAEWLDGSSGRGLVLAGCGGWSRRKTLFGADRGPGRAPDLLNPAKHAAKIRAIFGYPQFARQGLGSMILAHV